MTEEDASGVVPKILHIQLKKIATKRFRTLKTVQEIAEDPTLKDYIKLKKIKSLMNSVFK